MKALAIPYRPLKLLGHPVWVKDSVIRKIRTTALLRGDMILAMTEATFRKSRRVQTEERRNA